MRYKSDSLIGKTIDNYTINRLIAKGGMGRVYEAVEKGSNRKIALKVLALEEERASEIMERFQREAQSLGRLESHPNIVTIYRYGEVEGIHYIAMQLIEGVSLAEYYNELKNKGKYIESGELLHIVKQVVNALDYAHERGVIHRDIKPGNIMLETDPKTGQKRAILMDFGLVMQLDTQTTAGVPTLGLAFGTPRYIAPEQAISSQQASPQSDIYSLAVVVFELLAGRPPFDDSDTPMSVALSHINKKPPSPRDFRAEVSDSVSRVVLKALEKEPKNRYATAIEFYTALEDAYLKGTAPVERKVNKAAQSAIPSPQPTPHFHPEAKKTTAKRGRLGMMVAALAVIALLVAGGIMLFSGGDDNQEENTPEAAENTTGGDKTMEIYYSEGTLSIRNPTNRPMNYSG
ncbi:MAG: serine/threonine protein kinase, partial [Anaerolineae bacterium]|nr:serine/threonine protein kinase [Anaerolineae bacterium]